MTHYIEVREFQSMERVILWLIILWWLRDDLVLYVQGPAVGINVTNFEFDDATDDCGWLSPANCTNTSWTQWQYGCLMMVQKKFELEICIWVWSTIRYETLLRPPERVQPPCYNGCCKSYGIFFANVLETTLTRL